MNLFRDKYRIESARLKGYDYSSAGAYFVTICTKNYGQWFGKIENGEMNLSKTGAIVDAFWRAIPNHFRNIRLDEHVVMPNHVHGIIRIMDNFGSGLNGPIGAGADSDWHTDSDDSDSDVETPKLGVSTVTSTAIPTTSTAIPTSATVSRKPTIGIIVNQFKRICTITTKKTMFHSYGNRVFMITLSGTTNPCLISGNIFETILKIGIRMIKTLGHL